MLNKNEFGKLVKIYRKQRGWTQEELADHWGHTGSYVSQIEGGRRKLDSVSEMVQLADTLDIPSEKLEAIGRGIPTRKLKVKSTAQADDTILQMLLASGKDTVKLSYMVWLVNQHSMTEENLHNLTVNLGIALTTYQGEFMKPAQQLLACAHQMMGKIAFDRLDYARASGHFSEMIDLGHELNDSDTIALGMIRQGDLLRKKGRYETALRCFEAAKPYVDASDHSIQGLHYINIARSHYFLGDEQKFLRSISPALEIATQIKRGNNSLAYWFNLDVALQFQASGYTALQMPEKAIKTYKEIEQLHPSRPLRDQGAYTIEKARAYLELGDLEEGIKLSLKGLQLAYEYRSKRHIARLDATYNHLRMTLSEKLQPLSLLQNALKEAQREQAEW